MQYCGDGCGNKQQCGFGHEGRGVGLVDKLRAYAAQDGGLDTVDAQTALGLPVDARDYVAGAAILADLGVARLDLLTNNPDKVEALRALGFEVTPQRLAVSATRDNTAYLRAKRDRLGHRILLADVGDPDEERASPRHRTESA